MLEISKNIQIPDDELRFTFARSGGPGGQNVNKVNTKATLHWNAAGSPSVPDEVRHRFCKRYASRITTDGDIVIHSQRYRDQSRNVNDCQEKLRAMLLKSLLPPKKRKPTKPTRASKERRLKEKKSRGEKKRSRGRTDWKES